MTGSTVMFHRQFFLPKPCVCQLNLTVPAIHACSKRATSAFAFAYACKLLAKSSTQCRLLPVLVYPICDWRCRRNGKGLAYDTNLSSHKSESQVVKISGLKSMSEMVQKMLKQQSTQRKCRCKSSRRQNQNSLPAVAVQTP